MKPIQEQTILVTGATDGHGRGVALELAERGATVLLHGRDEKKLAILSSEIHEIVGAASARSYRADFASLDQVRDLAKAVLEREPVLDALVANAGIGASVPGGPARLESRDGYELRFQVNYLAHYLLTRELLPLLRRSAPARIVCVASAGQTAIDFTDPMLKRAYSGTRAYCQSKLAQILFAFDLAEELDKTGMTVNALHPATHMPTKIVTTPATPLNEGVFATVRLVVDPALEGVSGRYFEGLHESRAHSQAYEPDARWKLRALSDALIARRRAPASKPRLIEPQSSPRR